jgi:hypothetical protein
MGMQHISLNQGLQRIEVSDLQIQHPLLFAYFDALSADKRDEMFVRALQIGVLALNQERLAAFLAKTTNELGTELESLKMIFDMKAELFAKSTVKGAMAEADIAEYLAELTKKEGHSDEIELTGNTAGALHKNKTGDIICFLDGDRDRKIVIECKFDKGIRLGEITDQDWYGKRIDSALGQLIEAQANRACSQAIIVFDQSSINAALLKRVGNIAYHPGFGFIVVVDSLRGKFDNLGLAYMLARDLASVNRASEIETELLVILMDRIVSDAGRLLAVRKLVESNIDQSKQIISALEQGMLSLDFSRTYLKKFLEDGTLSRADMHHFYAGGDRREKYLSIGEEIKAL